VGVDARRHSTTKGATVPPAWPVIKSLIDYFTGMLFCWSSAMEFAPAFRSTYGVKSAAPRSPGCVGKESPLGGGYLRLRGRCLQIFHRDKQMFAALALKAVLLHVIGKVRIFGFGLCFDPFSRKEPGRQNGEKHKHAQVSVEQPIPRPRNMIGRR
jgi:hypothetical protein